MVDLAQFVCMVHFLREKKENNKTKHQHKSNQHKYQKTLLHMKCQITKGKIINKQNTNQM